MPTAVKKPCPVKPALAQLKSLNADQLNRLQTKQQQDLDLLDDIRSFLKQRATIEKDYGQSLLKLTASYLQKKDYAVSAFEVQNTHGKNLVSVWKSVLETNDTFARESLALSDQLSAQCSEPLKQFRGAKVMILKRTMDQLKALQSDLQASVGELTKAAKAYQDVEHETHETRVKAGELDEKLKKKSTGLFSSRANMEKTSQKLATKRDACELKSVAARNDYLFSLAVCNAANSRFWQTDLIELTQQLDSDAHSRMRDSLLTAMRSELQLACSKQERFGRLLMDLTDVSQTYQLECFLEEYASLFTEQPSYFFEPADGDPITYLLGNETDLVADAKKIAHRYVADVDAKQTLERQLRHTLQAQQSQQSANSQQAGSTSTADDIGSLANAQPGELDTRIDDLKQQIRRLEIQSCRAEAKLNLFRSTSAAAIDIDDLISKLQAELQASKPPQPPSPPSTPAVRPQATPASAPTSTPAPTAAPTQSNHQRAVSKLSVNSVTAQSNSTVTSNDGHREVAATQSNAAPYVVTWDDEPEADVAPAQSYEQQTDNATFAEFDDDDPLVVAALYDFEASNTDELTVRAGERLRTMLEPTINEQGWIQVENASGQRGIVPEAYVQFTNPNRNQVQDQFSPAQTTQVDQNTAFSNEADYANWGDYDTGRTQNDNYDSRQDTRDQNRSVSIAFDQYHLFRALYEYEAQSDDELNLREGDYLLIDLSRADGGEGDDDDGWWFGCLVKLAQDVLADSGVRVTGCGMFPSLVVEPIDESDWLELGTMALSKETLDSLAVRVAQLKTSLALAREAEANAARDEASTTTDVGLRESAGVEEKTVAATPQVDADTDVAAAAKQQCDDSNVEAEAEVAAAAEPGCANADGIDNVAEATTEDVNDPQTQQETEPVNEAVDEAAAVTTQPIPSESENDNCNENNGNSIPHPTSTLSVFLYEVSQVYLV